MKSTHDVILRLKKEIEEHKTTLKEENNMSLVDEGRWELADYLLNWINEKEGREEVTVSRETCDNNQEAR